MFALILSTSLIGSSRIGIQNTGDFYLRPDVASFYNRPDGTSYYLRP